MGNDTEHRHGKIRWKYYNHQMSMLTGPSNHVHHDSSRIALTRSFGWCDCNVYKNVIRSRRRLIEWTKALALINRHYSATHMICFQIPRIYAIERRYSGTNHHQSVLNHFVCCLLEDQQWSIFCICLRFIPYLFSITLIISYIYVYMYSYHMILG